MPPATLEAPPTVRVETVNDASGNPYTRIVGVPGRTSPIALCKPIPGVAQREIHEFPSGGQTYLRAWHTEVFFKGSKLFPQGLEIGFRDHMTQPENGQPYVENSFMQMGEDAYLHLKACADGRSFLTLPERRRLAAESEQYRMEKSAMGEAREGTKTPLDAIDEVADERLAQRIAEASEKAATAAVDAVLAKYDLVPKKGKKGAAPAADTDG